MVEIRYGENYDVADVAGKTIARVRNEFKSKLNIPDKARARLNEKIVSRRLEHEVLLNDNDRLVFTEKSYKALLFLTAVLLALAVTAGIFAFTVTTTTVTLNLNTQSEFASVAAAPSPPTWNVWKAFKGRTSSGSLFKIMPATDYTGDLSVMVTLTNGYNLVETYRVLVFKISVYEDNGTGSGPDINQRIGESAYLSLSKGEIIIDLTSLAGRTAPYWVYLDSGFYQSHTNWAPGNEDPVLLCDIVQKGAM